MEGKSSVDGRTLLKVMLNWREETDIAVGMQDFSTNALMTYLTSSNTSSTGLLEGRIRVSRDFNDSLSCVNPNGSEGSLCKYNGAS